MNVLQAAREVARAFPGGASALARLIQKNPTTLAHELNPPEGSLAKLGLATAVAMTEASGDDRILHAFALQRGFRCARLSGAPNDRPVDLNAAMLAFSKESAETVTAMHRAAEHISENEIHKFEREFWEMVEVMASVAERMRLLTADQAKARALPRAAAPYIVSKMHVAHATA